MVKVKLNGLMAENMKENTLMIKSMELALSIGLMVENIMVLGRMANSMVEVNISCLLEKKELVNGLMAKESNGYNKMLKPHQKLQNLSEYLFNELFLSMIQKIFVIFINLQDKYLRRSLFFSF